MALCETKVDPRFKYEVASRPGGDRIKTCFACGVCTAGCPVAEVDEEYNPRRIIRKVLLGLREEVLSSDLIWLCTTCHTCHAHCPQDVRFTDIMGVLREMAVEHGFVHPSFLERMEQADEFSQKVRRALVLSMLPGKAKSESVDFRALLAGVVNSLGSGEE
ncbi:MAG: 4Fe-4S dicluster domain-containing protein [Bacillota bacterium]